MSIKAVILFPHRSFTGRWVWFFAHNMFAFVIYVNMMRRVIKSGLNYRFLAVELGFFFYFYFHIVWNWKLFFFAVKTKAASIKVQSEVQLEKSLNAITKVIKSLILFYWRWIRWKSMKVVRARAQFSNAVNAKACENFHGEWIAFPWISFFVQTKRKKKENWWNKRFQWPNKEAVVNH